MYLSPGCSLPLDLSLCPDSYLGSFLAPLAVELFDCTFFWGVLDLPCWLPPVLLANIILLLLTNPPIGGDV